MNVKLAAHIVSKISHSQTERTGSFSKPTFFLLFVFFNHKGQRRWAKRYDPKNYIDGERLLDRSFYRKPSQRPWFMGVLKWLRKNDPDIDRQIGYWPVRYTQMRERGTPEERAQNYIAHILKPRTKTAPRYRRSFMLIATMIALELRLRHDLILNRAWKAARYPERFKVACVVKGIHRLLRTDWDPKHRR